MGDFHDAIAGAMDVWFADAIADTINYNGQDIRGHIRYDKNLDERTGTADARATIIVKQADVPAPDYRDPVVIGSQTWLVRSISSGDGLTWELELYRDERPVI